MSPTRSSGCSRSAPQAHHCTQRSTERPAASGHPAAVTCLKGSSPTIGPGTVTFHLTRPDPDFLYKLTVSYAYVLPASTPERQARDAPSSHRPVHDHTLCRGPRAAIGTQPLLPRMVGGRPALRIPRSHNDPAGAVPSPGRHRDRRRSGRLRSESRAATGPGCGGPARQPPRPGPHQSRAGDELSVPQHQRPAVHPGRRASSAEPCLRPLCRRRRLGGTLAAKPTCQLLPPAIPGYRRHCPDTSHPSDDGRWKGTDLAQAKRLVAASGTRGMRVVVWNVNPSPSGAIEESRLAVTALRKLGYRASLRLLPESTYFTYTGDSRNRAQVIDGGFSADYASASDFIGKFTCGKFVARHGLDTTDDSEFCNARFDRQVEQRRLATGHAARRRRQAVEPSGQEADRPRDARPYRHPQRGRCRLPSHPQLPVQPGLGSATRPAHDSVSSVRTGVVARFHKRHCRGPGSR